MPLSRHGFMRGILSDDRPPYYVATMTGEKVELPKGASDAWLNPYHVDRSKLLVLERLGGSATIVDAEHIAAAIECTRFPSDLERPVTEEGALARAADLIGQLGDPFYLRKAFAPFCEFREIGVDKALGYTSATDVIERYPDFFWKTISPHLGLALRVRRQII